MPKPVVSFVREDQEESDRLKIEETVIRKCLAAVRQEYTRLQGEWLFLLEMFEEFTNAEEENNEAKTKRGHERLEKMYSTLKSMRKAKRRPMEIVEVGGVEDIKGMLAKARDNKIAALKQEQPPDVPGTSSTPDSGDQSAYFMHMLNELDEELHGGHVKCDYTENNVEHKVEMLSDYETDFNDFADMDFMANQ
ncbi:hypothetical protein AAG570_013746 [Ranatra chinensis]|uniref:Uncharacterized protein n=1 Tax=Ranatra chinensis TaxID=642074 RepID=A0ABD0YRU3_9HEMI